MKYFCKYLFGVLSFKICLYLIINLLNLLIVLNNQILNNDFKIIFTNLYFDGNKHVLVNL